MAITLMDRFNQSVDIYYNLKIQLKTKWYKKHPPDTVICDYPHLKRIGLEHTQFITPVRQYVPDKYENGKQYR